jgi:hypothetical protein
LALCRADDPGVEALETRPDLPARGAGESPFRFIGIVECAKALRSEEKIVDVHHIDDLS